MEKYDENLRRHGIANSRNHNSEERWKHYLILRYRIVLMLSRRFPYRICLEEL